MVGMYQQAKGGIQFRMYYMGLLKRKRIGLMKSFIFRWFYLLKDLTILVHAFIFFFSVSITFNTCLSLGKSKELKDFPFSCLHFLFSLLSWRALAWDSFSVQQIARYCCGWSLFHPFACCFSLHVSSSFSFAFSQHRAAYGRA